MKITEIRGIPINIPLAKSYAWLFREEIALQTTSVIVEVMTDEGVSGFGESPLPNNHHTSTNELLRLKLIPLCLGEDPFNIERIIAKIQAGYRSYWYKNYLYAGGAIEMALYDIICKTLGTPLYNLLGGKTRDSVQYLGEIGIGSPEENAQLALTFVGQGYKDLRLKVGRNDDDDIRRVRAVREVLPSGVNLKIDANGAWSPSAAVRIIKKLERYDLDYVEQPVAAWDINGMAEVKRKVDVPIVADESCYTAQDALVLIEKKAADIFAIRIEEAGGILNLKKLVGIAEAAGIPCVMGAWGSTCLTTLASAHFVASSNNFPYANDTAYPNLTEDISVGGKLSMVGGRLEIPNKPSIGVEVDRSKLAEYEFRQSLRD